MYINFLSPFLRMLLDWPIKIKTESEHINEKGDGPYRGFDY